MGNFYSIPLSATTKLIDSNGSLHCYLICPSETPYYQLAVQPFNLLTCCLWEHNTNWIKFSLLQGQSFNLEEDKDSSTLGLNFAQNFALLTQDSASQHHQCFLSQLKHN